MSVHPRLQITRDQDVTVITFGPELKTINEDHLAEVSDVLIQASQQDPPLVVIDLQGVEFFSSSFIESLFRMWNRLNKRSGRFVLCNLFPYCREVLKITNLQALWTLCDTRADAIAALKAPVPTSH